METRIPKYAASFDRVTVVDSTTRSCVVLHVIATRRVFGTRLIGMNS